MNREAPCGRHIKDPLLEANPSVQPDKQGIWGGYQQMGALLVTGRLALGQLVQYAGSPGVGRVGAVKGDRVRVDFFESVAEPIVFSQWLLDSECRAVALGAETRVFRRNPDTGDWLAGRVKALIDNRYFVQFPNSSYDFPVAADELRVRWNGPIADPVSTLTAGGNESAYFRNARLPFLYNLVAQRAASASTASLLSSGVELFPHQVWAALTVLSDPVQRYLLADEVGLGKTIQAGFVIRQTLLDRPDARICVLAPEVLRRQWVRELCEKFFIGDFPNALIKCLPHEAPERWEEFNGCDLVVVDEAHRLVQYTAPEDSTYQRLTTLAHSSPSLLLLSATPVMSHRITQLGLLHLLDPDLYRWNDLEAFERRHRLRSRLADAVNNLDADFTYMIPSAVEEIGQLVAPEDTGCDELSKAIMELLDDQDELRPDAAYAELKDRTEALRAHISEAYRLHRRVIRRRRATVLRDSPSSDFLPYEVRGRQDPEVLPLRTPELEALQAALARWRSRVWDHLVDQEQEGDRSDYAIVLAVLTSRVGGHHQDFFDALAWRLDGDTEAAERAGLTPEERTLLAGPPVLTAERTVLKELQAEANTADNEHKHLDALISAILPGLRYRHRAVVFCGPGQLASQLCARLHQRFSKVSFFEHTRRSGSEKSEEAVAGWIGRARHVAPRGAIRVPTVLIVDDSAEDGLNLQIADAAIHVRLPWSANQLEQRLGRLDRYRDTSLPGQITPVPQFRVGDQFANDSLPEAWAELLTEGYNVFSDSVSTMQDAIAEGLADTWAGGLESGAEGLTGQVETVRSQLRKARQEIEKMELLEAIHESVSEEQDIAGALLQFEHAWANTRKTLLDYVAGPGGVKIRMTERTVDGANRQIFDLAQSQPLIDPRRWNAMRVNIPPAAAQGVFNRSVALRSPGIRLLRSGNPLVDAFATEIYHDDRGQASAFRRFDRRHHGAPVPYFGFDFLVEADLSAAQALTGDQPHVTPALRRQADRLLAPFTLQVWIEAGVAEPLTSQAAIAWLNDPYDNRRDRNYNSQQIPELLELLGGWEGYRQAAQRAERVAREHLAEVTDLAERCAHAQNQARRRVAVMAAQAQTRRAAGHLLSDTESLLTDVSIAKALTDGLTGPVIKVVSVTCIVRSGLERIGDANQ